MKQPYSSHDHTIVFDYMSVYILTFANFKHTVNAIFPTVHERLLLVLPCPSVSVHGCNNVSLDEKIVMKSTLIIVINIINKMLFNQN